MAQIAVGLGAGDSWRHVLALENCARTDLDSLEQAEGYRALQDLE